MDKVYKLLHSIGSNIEYHRLSSNQITILKADNQWVKTNPVKLIPQLCHSVDYSFNLFHLHECRSGPLDRLNHFILPGTWCLPYSIPSINFCFVIFLVPSSMSVKKTVLWHET